MSRVDKDWICRVGLSLAKWGFVGLTRIGLVRLSSVDLKLTRSGREIRDD